MVDKFVVEACEIIHVHVNVSSFKARTFAQCANVKWSVYYYITAVGAKLARQTTVFLFARDSVRLVVGATVIECIWRWFKTLS